MMYIFTKLVLAKPPINCQPFTYYIRKYGHQPKTYSITSQKYRISAVQTTDDRRSLHVPQGSVERPSPTLLRKRDIPKRNIANPIYISCQIKICLWKQFQLTFESVQM